ncbi:MAG: protein phosphatase 2C domain-containing protein [Planctomycetota bacterium]
MSPAPGPSITFHGPDFVAPGAVEVQAVGSASAAGFSVGRQAAIDRKTKEAVANEDALFLLDDGERAIHIVADGHYGAEASRELVASLSEIVQREGPGLDLAAAWGKMARDWRGKPDLGMSRSTVVFVCLDRPAGRIRGLSIGDSACFLAGDDGAVVRVDAPSRSYAAPWDLYSLGLPASSHIDLPVAAGSVLLSCTDGITECRYGKPDESIQPEHIGELVELSGGNVEALVSNLADLALRGIAPSPEDPGGASVGGEDNLAIAASRA